MKIIIEKREPDHVQKFFSAPLAFDQKVTVKKLLIVDKIIERMKSLGLTRSKLAEKMQISSARVSTMMNGTNNFTIETLMRAADAVDAELEMTIVPKAYKIRWITYQDNDPESTCIAFTPRCQPVEPSNSIFKSEEVAKNDQADAA